MKKLILIIFTFLIWSQKPAISGEVAMIGVVDGMICLECQKKVTTELKAATGENDIGVSWQESVAFINFSGSTTFSEKDFKNLNIINNLFIVNITKKSLNTFIFFNFRTRDMDQLALLIDQINSSLRLVFLDPSNEFPFLSKNHNRRIACSDNRFRL